ncbi:murein DD-endopeptidase MepM/ murein hydrolase activator NlpD, partial [Chitinivorax tropicus]
KGGLPTKLTAPIFTSENLYLQKANEKYRAYLVGAAKRYRLTPHALAAMVNAEAAKVKKTGEWLEDSVSTKSTAAGLSQFVNGTWYACLAAPGTQGNQAALAYLKVEQLEAASGMLFYPASQDKGKTKLRREVSASDREKMLAWRMGGEMSIDALAWYMRYNLAIAEKALKKSLDKLPPDELAKIAYVLHHEGSAGYFTGEYRVTKKIDFLKRLGGQLGGKTKTDSIENAEKFSERHGFGEDYVSAYYYWLANHTDTHVRASEFMIDKGGFVERSAFDVFEDVAGFKIPRSSLKPVEKPKPKERPTPKAADKTAPAKPTPADKVGSGAVTTKSGPGATHTSPPTASAGGQEVGHDKPVGGAAAWCNPLARCAIRVGGYKDSEDNPASARSKSLFKGRGGKHKGIDLQAAVGTPIYAVANAEVFMIASIPGYGKTLVLQVNINDLAAKQKAYIQTIADVKNDTVYFLYAHLSEVSVSKKSRQKVYVKCGEAVGKTGETGWAKDMKEVGTGSAIKYGGHLHFEVRSSPNFAKGKGKFFDPLPLIDKLIS